MDWISVKERLPEDCEKVIAWGMLSIESKMSAHEAFYSWIDKKWYSVKPFPYKVLTHWMPLPEPPKEQP